MAAHGQLVELAKDAPDSYIVVKGDTLWDISGKFLTKPWRWPEIWQLNREQIKDPHWIYPGDVIYLDRSGSSPRLRLGKPFGEGDLPTVKLTPKVRSEGIARDAITTVKASAIAHYLNRPLIVDDKGPAENPRIIGTQEGRVYLSTGDLAYVRGIADDQVTDWHVYRAAKPLLDPDTRKPIAYEALFVGSAHLTRPGDPATLRIDVASEEIGIGDRLMPAERSEAFNYVPHPPEQDVRARIISVYHGVSQVGRNSVVAINAGREQGVDPGTVLSVLELGRTVIDREDKDKARIKLPDEPIGQLLIFRIFDKISYGLVVRASKAITLGDVVVKP
ncbi:MAG: LysM peptidoglycan-binding domain-containing protein [Burkholderiaceae bacterium]|nr:LysM peptidoglycan-binding domain-containing protein [Burkholderiaceae bacterium]